MAGEWLKFEANTPEKQEVFSITVAMGWPDPDLTVGKLLKVWRWFDQQTIDGNAPRVTLALLDHIVGVSGFAQAMCDVGWLVCGESGVSLPNFDRHNGKTAKDRCLTAKRVAKHKANGGTNAAGNGASVSGALPREEKRREEKEENLKTNSAAAPSDVVIERRADRLEAIEQELEVEVAAAKAARQAEIEMEQPAFTLPLNTGDEFPIMAAQVAEFGNLYPAVDVMQELKKMRGWLLGSPARRKTNKGVMRFVTSWLAKQQDEGAPRRPNGIAPNRQTGRPSINAPFTPGADDDIFNQLKRSQS